MKPNTSIPTASTTLHDLLRMGASIRFGSGRSMKGTTRDGYIAVSNEFGPLGVWDLDTASGVDDAVTDLVRDARESEMDIHGNSTAKED